MYTVLNRLIERIFFAFDRISWTQMLLASTTFTGRLDWPCPPLLIRQASKRGFTPGHSKNDETFSARHSSFSSVNPCVIRFLILSSSFIASRTCSLQALLVQSGWRSSSKNSSTVRPYFALTFQNYFSSRYSAHYFLPIFVLFSVACLLRSQNLSQGRQYTIFN